jgi:hypothetical protein
MAIVGMWRGTAPRYDYRTSPRVTFETMRCAQAGETVRCARPDETRRAAQAGEIDRAVWMDICPRVVSATQLRPLALDALYMSNSSPYALPIRLKHLCYHSFS